MNWTRHSPPIKKEGKNNDCFNPKKMKAITLILTMNVTLWGADSCALTLRVLSADGKPLEHNVLLLNDKGTVEKKAKSLGGTVTFCDFSYGKHELVIAPSDCLPTRISNVQIVPNQPLHLVATVNSCRGYPIWMSGAMFERDLTACILQVRVKDQSGIPLPEVSLTMAGSEPVVELTTPDPAPSVIMPNFKLMDQNTITDPYGRVWLMMSTAHTKNYFGVGRVVFAKPGFAAKGRV